LGIAQIADARDLAAALQSRNGVRDNLGADDFVGALREKRGIGPLWPNGKPMDHAKKVRDFLLRFPESSARLHALVQGTPAEAAVAALISSLYELQKRALLLISR